MLHGPEESGRFHGEVGGRFGTWHKGEELAEMRGFVQHR